MVVVVDQDGNMTTETFTGTLRLRKHRWKTVVGEGYPTIVVDQDGNTTAEAFTGALRLRKPRWETVVAIIGMAILCSLVALSCLLVFLLGVVALVFLLGVVAWAIAIAGAYDYFLWGFVGPLAITIALFFLFSFRAARSTDRSRSLPRSRAGSDRRSQ